MLKATIYDLALFENILGVIELSDTIKDESPAAIADLKKMGLVE